MSNPQSKLTKRAPFFWAVFWPTDRRHISDFGAGQIDKLASRLVRVHSRSSPDTNPTSSAFPNPLADSSPGCFCLESGISSKNQGRSRSLTLLPNRYPRSKAPDPARYADTNYFTASSN
jgi:hypothetical protein